MRHPSKLLAVMIMAVALLDTQPLIAEEPVSYAERLSSYLSAIATLTGNFQQSISDPTNQFSTVYIGTLWISKPKYFRIDTVSPSNQSIVSDGNDFWSYDQDLEQVIVSKLNNDLNQVPILLFSTDIESIKESYDITGYEDGDGEHFLLHPVSDVSLFQSLVLGFRGKVPVSIRINAANGQMTTFKLEQMVINEHIPAEQFSFDAPDNVDVIDDR